MKGSPFLFGKLSLPLMSDVVGQGSSPRLVLAISM